MSERFIITNVLICPVHLMEDKNLKLDKNYTLRLCVIDLERNIAVDVEHQLQYVYIKTMSGLYYKNIVLNKDINNKRAALFDCEPSFGVTNKYHLLLKAYEIRKNLELGKEYPDGNKMLDNDEYLELLNSEEEKIKVKKLEKRKK